MEHEVGHHFQLAFGQAIAKRRHAVAAVGDLVVDLGLGLELEFALTKAWDLRTVGEDFPSASGPWQIADCWRNIDASYALLSAIT